MKTKVKIIIMATVLLAITMDGCKKPPLPPPPPPTTAPIVETVSVVLASANENGAYITATGKIISDGGASITKRGFYMSKTSSTPTAGDIVRNSNSFSPNYTEDIKLEINSRYYVRAYAKNKNGTSYGKAMSIKTDWLVKDFDGNNYHTVKIGKQWWLKEDLKVTHYSDGTPIPNVTGNVAWMNQRSGAYCNYDNEDSLVKVHGRLYNFYAVETGRLGITGWHVPTEDEWLELYIALGNNPHNGGKLKEVGTEHWQAPNTGATDQYGFTAIPGGDRGADGFGEFHDLHTSDTWWANKLIGTNRGSVVATIYRDDVLYILMDSPKETGLSIRLIKNK